MSSTHPDTPLPFGKMLWRLGKTFGADLWTQRRLLGLSYLYTVVAVAALLFAPWPLQMIIDKVIAGKPPPLLDALSPDLQIVLLALLAIGVAVVRALFSALEKITNAKVRERVALNLRDRLLNHLQSLPLASHAQQRSGELVLRLVDDVNIFARFLTKALPLIFNHALTTISTLVVMYWLEPRLAAVGAAVLIIITALARFYTTPLRTASRAKRGGEGRVAALAQEIMRGLPSVQALGLEQYTRGRFRAVNSRSLRAGVQEVRVAVSMERAMSIAKAFALAVMSAAGALLVLRQALSVGELTVFVAYMTQLLKPVEKVNEMAASMIRGLTRGEKLLQLLDSLPSVKERSDAIKLTRARGDIELRGVSFAYPQSDSAETVFDNLSARIEPGCLCVLIGSSGGGKSTLLALLLRLYPPGGGEIRLDGIPLDQIRLADLRRQFAVVVQQTHLFAGTLREALCLGESMPDSALWNALEQVALADHVRTLAAGLDALLGEDGANLSGGQRARLGLARAFLLDRPILLLDEPTANVDPVSRQVILDALHRIRQGRTCIVVTHQQDVAERADRVLHLVKKRLLVETPLRESA